MFQQLIALFNLDQYTDPFSRRSARNVGLVGITFGLLMVVFGFVTLLSGPNPDFAFFIVGEVAGIGLAFFSVYLVRLGMARYAGLVFIGFVLAVSLGLTQTATFEIRHLDALWIAIIMASIMAFEGTVLASGGLSLLIFLIGLETYGQLDNDATTVVAGILLLTVLGLLATDSLRRTVDTITKETAQRSRLLETSSNVTASVFQRMDLATLLAQTVDNIRDRFETVYHAQVFLIDDHGRDAVLEASTGEVGQQLIARGHRLGVSSQSVIGQVTSLGEPVLAGDTSVDPVHRKNELLPDTRTELALPLRVADGVIGALDLQSLQPNAFSAEDIEVFQLLADQIALAIENARLVDNLQSQLESNDQLLAEQQESLREIEQLNRELMGQGWADFLQIKRPTPVQTIEIDSGAVQRGGTISSVSRAAMDSGRVEIEQTDDGHIIGLPVRVEGVTIGVIEFNLPPGQIISPGVIDGLQDLRDRLGLVAENARLFARSQMVATRERTVGQAAEQLQQSRDLNSLLTQAAPLLNDILQAKQTRIRLGQSTPPASPPSEPGGDGTNGHQAT